MREKLLCFLIMLVGYIAFLGGLLLILSKMFDDSFSYTFLITKNNVELITMTKYMFIYEFMNVVYISIFFCLIYLLLTLIFNKTLISTSIIILIFALIFALSAISPKIGFYLGMTNDFSNAATVKMEFFLSKLILLLPIVLFIVSIRYFKRKNLNC